MGLKEKVQSVQGKRLMGSVFAAEMLDTVMTKVELSHLGGTEVSPFGGVELMNRLGPDGAFIAKTAVVAILIGSYALASNHDFKLNLKSKSLDVRYSLERTLQWGNLLAWGVIAWNTANMAPDLVAEVGKRLA